MIDQLCVFCACLLKINNKLKFGCFYKFIREEFSILWGVFNKTIIVLALVGYEMIIANSALRASLALYISNAHLWNNC